MYESAHALRLGHVSLALCAAIFSWEKMFLPLLQSSIVILPFFLNVMIMMILPLLFLRQSSRLPILCNTVCFAGIKWKKKFEKEKTPRGKDGNTPGLISLHPCI